MFNDIRYAFRILLKQPGHTLFVILTLALGIGATTAIFSAINSVILNPLPLRDANRLMQIGQRTTYQDGRVYLGGVSPPVFEAIRAQENKFDGLTWFDQMHLDRKTEDFVDQMIGFAVAPNFFTMLGASPMLGRTFTKDEGEPETEYRAVKGASVIILGHSTWMSLFGGDPSAVGRAIELSGRRFTIVGVMPPEFSFPWGDVRFWVPSKDERVQPNLITAPNCNVIVRLKSDGSQEQAQVQADTLAKHLFEEYGSNTRRGYGAMWSANKGLSLFVRPARLMFADNNADFRQTLFGLLAAVGFILLIVCANVANLTLARSEGRLHELSIRAAMGAGRLRLIRQSLTECIVLSVLGGVAGLLVANVGVNLLSATIPHYMPRIRAICIDSAALGFAMFVSIAAGIVFGLAPAWRIARTKQMYNLLKQGATNATAALSGKWLRGMLVITEVAMALILMVGAGLMIQSVSRMLRTNPGFNTDNLVQVIFQFPFEKYASPDNMKLRDAAFADLHQRLASVPGVTAVGIIEGSEQPGKCIIDGDTAAASIELEAGGCGVDEADCFRAMSTPLLAGRYLTKPDIGDKVGTVVINQMMAQMCWPGQNPIGRTFRTSNRGARVFEVIGVVGNIRGYSYNQEIAPTFYRPFQEFDYAGVSPCFVIRTQSDPHVITPFIRKALLAVEPATQMPSIAMWSDLLYQSTAAQRTYMLYLLAFALTGGALSAIGIYGVLAYSVARRTREIGIRMAMGAQRQDLLRMILREGLWLLVTGVVIGLAGALALTRFLQSQLFEISPTDPVALTAGSILLFCIGMLACYAPARRATRVDPIVALRSE